MSADMDELIASGEIDADPEAVRAARMRLLCRDGDRAFRNDIELIIVMAQAARKAAAKAATQTLKETKPVKEPKAPRVLLTPDERRERERERQHRSYIRRRDAEAATEARSD